MNLPLNTISAKAKYIRMSPTKVRRVLKQIEGRSESTRLNSSHTVISYAVFCLKKKKKTKNQHKRQHRT